MGFKGIRVTGPLLMVLKILTEYLVVEEAISIGVLDTLASEGVTK